MAVDDGDGAGVFVVVVAAALVGDHGNAGEVDLEVVAGVGLFVPALQAIAVAVDLVGPGVAGFASRGGIDLGAAGLAEGGTVERGFAAGRAGHTRVLGRMALARSTQATLSAGSRARRASSR